MKDEKTMVACCTDGVRPVVFKLERIEMSDSLCMGADTSEEVENSDTTGKNECIAGSNPEKPQAVSLELIELWTKVTEIMKRELTEISFSTWIKTIKPVSIDNRTVHLAVPSLFNKGILQQRYSELIKKSISIITGKEYQLEFSVAAVEQSNNIIEQHSAESDQKAPISLKPQYTFDSFVVGGHNQLAYKSAVEIAQNPCTGAGLLYIYAGTGLGKTHVLQAVGNFILMRQPAAKVKYITIDDFISEMIQAVREDSLQKFRGNLMENDVLLLDDLQHIAGKERTQEEFYKIVRSLLEDGKRVVIGCTKAPQDIFIMKERFSSLIEIGGSYEISKPDLNTRIEISKRKAAAENLELNAEIIGMVANEVSSNIRELISTLNRIASYSRLEDVIIDADMVKRILNND
jgi:chromosomal replication initiator protein